MSPEGTRFKYTSVLLILQCSINLLIATIGIDRASPLTIGNVLFGTKRKSFSSQIPKKDLVGRCVTVRNRGKEWVCGFRIRGRERCVIQDVELDGGTTRMTFKMKGGEIVERVLRESDVSLRASCDC